MDAVNSIPMLLERNAADWWQGVKTQTETFDDVVRMLREAFSPPKPDWRVYAEIYESHQQKNEPTDSCIRRKRSLFAQLKTPLNEAQQIDHIFGLLHSSIRERVLRSSVANFDDLLSSARELSCLSSKRKQFMVKRSFAISVGGKDTVLSHALRRKLSKKESFQVFQKKSPSRSLRVMDVTRQE